MRKLVEKNSKELLRKRISGRKNYGITLIALVITIIVLLILAGISISMLSGDNSILRRATEAKEKTDEARNKEDMALKYIEAKLMEEWNGNVATDFSGGTGTEDDPFKISNAEELAYFASLVNGGRDFTGEYVEIIKNINLGNKDFTPIGYGDYFENYSDDENFYETAKKFNGTLDGKNNIITGIKIDSEDMKKRTGIALIGTLGENGAIKNVVVDQGVINGWSYVGGIVGFSKGHIENCINNTNVTGLTVTGGIVGNMYKGGDIVNCINSGKIEGKDADKAYNIGGIVGRINMGGTVKGCANNGNIVSKVQSPGGICGLINTTGDIVDCVNNGEVFSESMFAGGIVGILYKSEGQKRVERCTNNGKVTSKDQSTGGIVGKQESGVVSNCENYGEVTSETYGVGGIVGWIKKCDNITGCINYGKITANVQRVAGIVGSFQEGKINYCVNYGEINLLCNEYNGEYYKGISGGIIGVCRKSDIEVDKVANFGKVFCKTSSEKDDYNGGIIGYIENGKANMVKNAYNKGIVEGGDYIGGIIGYNTISEAASNCFYYKAEGSNLPGIGGASETADTYFSGTSGDIEFDYESLDDFLSKKVSN